MFWQVDEVTGMMSENLQKIMERGEKMEELEDKAARLEEGSKQFQMSAAKVKKQNMLEHYKMKLILGGVVTLILVIVIVIIVSSV